MRFMILRKADEQTEAGVMPTDELIKAMGDYNDSMINAGVMQGGEGLKPTNKGFRVQFNNGTLVVTDGPFTETKELLAGYTIIDVPSKEDAIEWVKKWPAIDGDGNLTLEVREAYTLEDFAPSEGLDQIEDQFQRLEHRPNLLNTYLKFNGNCKEAFDHYAGILGGNIDMLMHWDEGPMADQIPPALNGKVMHAQLSMGQWKLMGCDDPQNYQAPNGFNVCVTIDDPEKAERAFAALADGGNVVMPMEETFWALRFGMCVDRFGVPWMVNCNKPM